MLRKIVFLMLMFSLFLGLNNCGGLKVREDYFEFRYNVEVVYTNVTEEGSNVTLYYILYDPIASGSNTVLGHIIMNKIGGNEARCYLPKVYVQREDEFVKHRVKVLQYICGEHNCHLKFSSNRTGSWRWDTYCPIYEDDGCGPHYEVKNRENVITIYKDKPNYKDIIYYIMN